MEDASLSRLTIENVSKSYGGIHALKDVQFDIAGGEVHALVGENGAGKSTLVKIITGLEAPDSGRLILDGSETRFRDPLEARANGVIAVYQDPKLFPNLDVAENIFMGVHPRTRTGFIDRKLMYRRTREVLAELGADLDPRQPVVSLSVGQMLLVEFARAIFDKHEKLLLLDEPTASLSPKEANHLFDVVRMLRKRGVAILFISHRIEELRDFADRITILRDGGHVLTTDMSNIGEEEIVRQMVGRSLQELRSDEGRDAARSEPGLSSKPRAALRVEGLSASGDFANVSFHIQAGEILGMAGLVGAGRTEIAKAIFGALPLAAGTVWINETPVKVKNPAQMISEGLVYIPEDRELEGLIADLSVVDNMLLPAVVKYCRFGFANTRKEREIYALYAEQFKIKSSSPRVRISSLSGGNRQKVVLAKWMSMSPKVILFDEPTHGIDVGTKAQVHRFIKELANNGLAILLISSDLPEILALSDRVLVIADGGVTGEFARREASQEKIMAAAIGARKDENQQ